MLGGVQKTTDFLDKSTWTLATVLILLILLSSLSFTSTSESKIIDEIDGTATPAATAPATTTPATTAPATTPVQPATATDTTK